MLAVEARRALCIAAAAAAVADADERNAKRLAARGTGDAHYNHAWFFAHKLYALGRIVPAAVTTTALLEILTD